MSKRLRSESPANELQTTDSQLEPTPHSKRIRLLHKNEFNRLSDELLLKIFTLLGPLDLTHCQQACRRFFSIAGDSQVWKAAFYNRFILPRVSRLPGNRTGSATPLPAFSSRSSKWLNDEGLARSEHTDWKKIYKLRHNWNRGRCDVSEIGISTEVSSLPISVKMRRGIVFSIDEAGYLQAWRIEDGRHVTTQMGSHSGSVQLGLPTALALDESETDPSSPKLTVVVGYHTGGFSAHQLDLTQFTFTCLYTNPKAATTHSIVAMTFSGLHLITMYDKPSREFTLYYLGTGADEGNSPDWLHLGAPTVITYLKSPTAWPLVSLSIRRSTHRVFVCIVYAFSTITMGWSVGIQELCLTPDGKGVEKSRIASALPPGSVSAASECPTLLSASPYTSPTVAFWEAMQHAPLSQPTSLSYAHPYLLTAHKDNTLTLYLVKTTASSLEITQGQRLWGHTSAVSEAHVGSRGRAVSISARGSELRVWELEGGVTGNPRGRESVRIYPSHSPASLPSPQSPSTDTSAATLQGSNWWDMDAQDKWLSFDDEKVLVHRQKDTGSQVFLVYDFT